MALLRDRLQDPYLGSQLVPGARPSDFCGLFRGRFRGRFRVVNTLAAADSGISRPSQPE